MEEIHQGICGPYMNGRMLAMKILRIGYYWNTMETDCVDFVKSCHDCQTHKFGRIAPKASNGHEYILVAIDDFTKWVEATSYSMLKAKHVA